MVCQARHTFGHTSDGREYENRWEGCVFLLGLNSLNDLLECALPLLVLLSAVDQDGLQTNAERQNQPE